jgi:hypothetical protein
VGGGEDDLLAASLDVVVELIADPQGVHEVPEAGEGGRRAAERRAPRCGAATAGRQTRGSRL